MIRKMTILSIVLTALFIFSSTVGYANTIAYAYLDFGATYAVSDIRWYDAGERVDYGVTNSTISNHTVQFYVLGEGSRVTGVHDAAPGQEEKWYFTAPFSGYYYLKMECNYRNSDDCHATGWIDDAN